MTPGRRESKNRDGVFEYLCVDNLLEDFGLARGLATAFELGLIDFMLQEKITTSDFLADRYGVGPQAMKLLLSLLSNNRVVRLQDKQVELTEEFLQAMKFRDLLEMKLQTSLFSAHDFLSYFSDLLCRPEQFAQESGFRRLFAYNRCFDDSRESYDATKQWMRITTVLTKYEAGVCLAHHDFSRYGRVLDVGGNSGEFVLRICKSHQDIMATVFDLPLVCTIGSEHVRPEPEAERITFVKGNALSDRLPGDFDLVSFKSVLHDWPDNPARRLMQNGWSALKPGGTMLIFERNAFAGDLQSVPFSLLPFFIFFHSFRSPLFYRQCMEDLGFEDIRVQEILLEMPFSLICARKPG